MREQVFAHHGNQRHFIFLYRAEHSDTGGQLIAHCISGGTQSVYVFGLHLTCHHFNTRHFVSARHKVCGRERSKLSMEPLYFLSCFLALFQHRFKPPLRFIGFCLESVGKRVQQGKTSLSIKVSLSPRNRFDAPKPCANTAFTQQETKPHGRSRSKVSSAAQLATNLSHAHYAHFAPVLFPKQRRSSPRPSVL